MEREDRAIAIYSRKSKFTGKGESIGNQAELCRQYIRNLMGEDAAESCLTFEDEGFSGGNLKRPDFKKMMAQVRQGKIRAIVVYRLDRISRNISDFAGLIDELTRLDVAFVSIREQFDTSTPMGRAMMFIISVFSQLERETIAERIRDNMLQLAKTGRWLGGNTPIGFRSDAVSKVTVEGKSKKSYMLVADPGEIETVKLIFSLYSRTESLTAVEAELLRRRVKTRLGKDFTRFSIRGILANPVYMTADEAAYRYFTEREAEICFPKEAFDGSCGIMAYNRTDQQKGRATRPLPVSQWIVAPGLHPGVVSSRQWIQVQESMGRNKTKGYRKPRTNEALLTGLLYCGCGGRMYPKLSGRKTPEGKCHFSYVCGMKRRSKGERCSMRNLDGIRVDDAVLAAIKQLEEDGIAFETLLRKNRSLFSGERKDTSRICELRAELSRNEKGIRGLLDAIETAEDRSVGVRLVERMEELTQTNEEISRRIRELEFREEARMTEAQMKAAAHALAYFPGCVDAMTVEQCRETLRQLISRVEWNGETVSVTLLREDSK